MMCSMRRKGIEAYAQVGIETEIASASPHKLILMLYDGAIGSILKAKQAMANGAIVAKCEAISKTVAIIQDGLQLSLDRKAGGELAENLNGLYDYMINRLAIANLKNKPEILDEVGRLLEELRSAWVTIDNKHPLPKLVEATAEQQPPPPQHSVALVYGKT